MKKYDLIIFDLDGTIMDTSDGIINCYNYTAKIFNRNELDREKFKGIIGSPLTDGFKNNYSMNDQEVKEAVKIYRRRYEEKGIYEATSYQGIPELLKKLKDNNYKTAVATLKLEKFAKKMLRDQNIDQYFDLIYGTNQEDSLKKHDLINKAVSTLNIEKNKVVLIGDSFYDSVGAKTANVDFIGVSYGLGFQNDAQIKQGYYTDCASSVIELENIILQK